MRTKVDILEFAFLFFIFWKLKRANFGELNIFLPSPFFVTVGHVFKSLNASGLIPKQGKLIADRVDGFW